jgi:hypothetical protein
LADHIQRFLCRLDLNEPPTAVGGIGGSYPEISL